MTARRALHRSGESDGGLASFTALHRTLRWLAELYSAHRASRRASEPYGDPAICLSVFAGLYGLEAAPAEPSETEQEKILFLVRVGLLTPKQAARLLKSLPPAPELPLQE